MIYLRLMVDNLYMFKDTVVDFTYPRKNPASTIEHEFLKEFPNIRFKRVCILMGANASGKTTLGKLLCAINNYLHGRPLDSVNKIIHDKSKPAHVDVIYITPHNDTIHQLTVTFNNAELLSEVYRSQPLYKSKSLDKTLEDLKNSPPKHHFPKLVPNMLKNTGEAPVFFSPAVAAGYHLDDVTNTVWHYMYSEFSDASSNFEHGNITLLESILKVFDPSILSVNAISGTENAYVIKFTGGDSVIVEDGKLANPERLSRGTIESIEVAQFINAIEQQKNNSGTFFLDEKMAYSHTEIEAAILNLMIEKLNPYSQLFYTTHNYDILEMNLPSHSFIFMKKDNYITVKQPEKMGFAKNDRSLLGYVKNDVFGTIPDISGIDDLL